MIIGSFKSLKFNQFNMKSLITKAFLFLLFVFTFHSIYAMKEYFKMKKQVVVLLGYWMIKR